MHVSTRIRDFERRRDGASIHHPYHEGPLADWRYTAASIGLLGIFGPALALQGYRIRKHAPRLPAPVGPEILEIRGDGPPVGFIVVGESTVAGAGVSDASDGLAHHTARALSITTKRAIQFQAFGQNGSAPRRDAHHQTANPHYRECGSG